MHLTIIASDLDGTLAEDGQIAEPTWQMLRAAKAAHMRLILVTGRTLASFAPDGPFDAVFDAIVAEDGAVVYFPQLGVTHLPFGRLPAALLEAIEGLDIPIERGMALVATHTPHDEPILRALRSCGGGATVEYNRGAVMVLPEGATKGSGLAYALRELGLSARNVVACGDAENDRSLLAAGELAVAVANATPELRAAADIVLAEPAGRGMCQLIGDLLAGRVGPRRARPERQVSLGQRADRRPLALDAWQLVDGVWGVAGDSASGKSWLAGLMAEALIGQGYQALVIDPEGDHRGLAALPRTMLVGGPDTRLQRVGDVMTLCEYAQSSLVVDLSWLPVGARSDYIERLLGALLDLRARRGRPHWIVLDEAQQSYAAWLEPAAETLLALMAGGGVALVSYRPSLLEPRLIGAVRSWALTRTGVAEDLALFDAIFAGSPGWAASRAQLPGLGRGQVQVLEPGGGLADTISFSAGLRSVPHIRHLNKYVTGQLDRGRWFIFRDPGGKQHAVAGNLTELYAAIERVPTASLLYHLERGDFARWVGGSLHDRELSRQLLKIAHRQPGADTIRAELQRAVGVRYEELAAML